MWTMATAAAIRDKLIGLLEPLIERLGYELVDIEWVSVPRSGVLRIFIDQPPEKGGHIGVEDCETVSREVSALLDVEDPISGAYNLEVSSPGFDRVLRKPSHFGRFVGARVWLELKVPREGRRRYTGDLSEVDESGCIVTVDGQPVRIGFAEIGKARLVA
jgi:ribosome maturation factor RimP